MPKHVAVAMLILQLHEYGLQLRRERQIHVRVVTNTPGPIVTHVVIHTHTLQLAQVLELSCKCCDLWPEVVGTVGEANANAQGVGASVGIEGMAKANAQGIGASAVRVGPEARSKHRMLRFEEASVGTEVNNHVDDLNILFAHLNRECLVVMSKSRRKTDHGKCASSSGISTDIHEQEDVQIHTKFVESSLTRFGVGGEHDVESFD